MNASEMKTYRDAVARADSLQARCEELTAVLTELVSLKALSELDPEVYATQRPRKEQAWDAARSALNSGAWRSAATRSSASMGGCDG